MRARCEREGGARRGEERSAGAGASVQSAWEGGVEIPRSIVVGDVSDAAVQGAYDQLCREKERECE